jgi:hypothetical protein
MSKLLERRIECNPMRGKGKSGKAQRAKPILLQFGVNQFAELGMAGGIGMQLIALERGVGEHLGQGILDQRDLLSLATSA